MQDTILVLLLDLAQYCKQVPSRCLCFRMYGGSMLHSAYKLARLWAVRRWIMIILALGLPKHSHLFLRLFPPGMPLCQPCRR